MSENGKVSPVGKTGRGVTFGVVNFEKFQHYKDRNPPWIKLHNTLLDSYEFGCLQDASKAHLLLIWLLASRHNNRLPLDEKWISERIQAKKNVDLDELIKLKFIECYDECGMLLADSLQHDSNPLDQRRGETEERISIGSQSLSPLSELWNQTFKDILPQVKQSGSRKKREAALLKQYTLEQIKEVFLRIGKSDFLLGKCPPRDPGGKVFMADYDWFLGKDKNGTENIVKVIEGKYDNRPVQRELTEDRVIL
ncbi:hypothetical protein [Candidatus Manganitrophus noduliformans]|uniref:Uncharacterized protein n=1 Tax=Candidatus Manganitrophus noduliformans TaxID=2606439 RepID=A0A7X6I9Z3_9BACT|nr:hypothetical protein [Candidatus Manganitrophus noduliformans]NKE69865.1 hypothetical protein [Candidatus Manganitrophus noduliformans]